MTSNPTQEKTKFWLDPNLSNLELLRATYITHAFTPHAHEGFAIGVIERGAETFAYRRADYTAPAGAIVVINPGELHTGQAQTEAGWTYRMLYPDASLLQQAASQVAGRPRDVPFFPQPIIWDADLARRILHLHATLEDSVFALEAQSRLLWTFAQLITRHADDRPLLQRMSAERRSVGRVRDYLETHYMEDISLEHLARLAHLSPFHLLRTFRHLTGLTPHAYATQVRVARAKRLLLAGLPLTQVALETGFSDQSHFTKRFKQIVGVTPGQYRASPPSPPLSRHPSPLSQCEALGEGGGASKI